MALLIDYFCEINLIDYELRDYKMNYSMPFIARWLKKCTFAPPKRMDR